MKVKIPFLTLFFIIISIYSRADTGALTGIGYGATEDEAKKEALADLSSAVKVRVYSKYEQQTAVKNGGEASVESSRFTRLISDVPFISPDVSYFKENGSIKAVAVINNPESYAAKAKELSGKIDALTDFPENAGRDLIYRQLEAAAPLYGEYEGYETVLTVLGISDYARPKISGSQARAMLLDMQSAPPSLEIAAEILTGPMKGRPNVYVSAPLTPGNDEVTPFAAFFRDMLSAKLKANKNKDAADYNMACSYTGSGGDVIMSCSLLSGGSAVVASSIVKIPGHLLKGSVIQPSSSDLMAVINGYDNTASSLRASVKISADGDPSMLKRGDRITLLVKANKPSYIYIVCYTRTAEAETANVLLLGINGAFILPVKEDQADKWISLGQFTVNSMPGSETLQVFALENPPTASKILPDYAVDNFGPLKARPERVAEDFMYLFSRQKGEKSISTLTYTIIGGKE